MLLRAREPGPIETIFTDLGGVLLTNGWDHEARTRAAEAFHLDAEEMMERHHLTFDTYETGKLDLDTYLERVVFYEPRPFSQEEFEQFMFAQSQPYPEALDFFRGLGACNGYRLAAISNEGRELADYRIEEFDLDEFVSLFVVSSFVRVRKPDVDIFHMALDLAHAQPETSVYVEDRLMFATVAHDLGFNAIHHTDLGSTRAALAELGVILPESWREAA